MINFNFITVVWGSQYTNLFLQIGLPSLLSQGNLGKIEKANCYKFNIYTTSNDAEMIYSSPAYMKLSKLIETKIHLIDDVVNSLNSGKISKYSATTICQGKAIEEASKDNNAFIFLCPDAVYPDKLIENIIKRTFDGIRMIVCGAPRVNADKVIPLLKDFYIEKEATLSISGRELLRVSLKNIHSNSKILFWDSHNFLNEWPSYLYWDVKGKGILQRGIHLHPLMMNPVRHDEKLKHYDVNASQGLGIDGHPYLSAAVPDIRDVYIATDSDEMYFLSLDYPTDYLPPPQKPSILRIAMWIKEYCNSHHIEFLKAKIRYHLEDLSSEWEEVENESDKVVNSILTCMDFYNRVPDVMEDFVRQQTCIQNLHSLIKCLLLDGVRLRKRLGEELFRVGNLEEAEVNFREALNITPDCVGIHMNLGNLYQKQARHNEAIWHLKQVLRSNNVLDKITGYYGLGLCYIGLERYQEAIPFFANTVKMIESLGVDEESDLNLSALKDYYTSASVKLIECLILMKHFHSAKKIARGFLSNKYFDLTPYIKTEISNLIKRVERFTAQDTVEV